MVKILEDEDIRNPDCAFRFVDKDLERGVGRTLLKNTEESSEISEESYVVESDHINDIRQQANSHEIAPDVIGQSDSDDSKPYTESEYSLSSSKGKKKKTKDKVSA